MAQKQLGFVLLQEATVSWHAGRMHGPDERVKAYRRCSRAVVRWFGRRHRPALIAGDFNEPADTSGRWSPRWIARHTGTHIWTTGGIDYVIGDRVKVTGMHNVADRGGSDHHARVFTVHPPVDVKW
jgi:endonuclease/exonuclease/phosphatase family metal-dependent hydrolase